MALKKLKLNPEKTEFIVFGSKAQHQKISADFPVSILGSLLHPLSKNLVVCVWFDAEYSEYLACIVTNLRKYALVTPILSNSTGCL